MIVNAGSGKWTKDGYIVKMVENGKMAKVKKHSKQLEVKFFVQ